MQALETVLQSMAKSKSQPGNRELYQFTSAQIGEYLNQELSKLIQSGILQVPTDPKTATVEDITRFLYAIQPVFNPFINGEDEKQFKIITTMFQGITAWMVQVCGFVKRKAFEEVPELKNMLRSKTAMNLYQSKTDRPECKVIEQKEEIRRSLGSTNSLNSLLSSSNNFAKTANRFRKPQKTSKWSFGGGRTKKQQRKTIRRRDKRVTNTRKYSR